ncbi:lytic polysaccharide monooxygenase [Nocardia sp. CDC159]|uniref:Lytic polysaccharide monooxygenase n=1 Tax=Nocardia pulmonis TaxID=2951408 RepID=A0A9X2IW92_9NOCA|nr:MULTISPECIES: carbohydrate-binding protein [Nocardia]MCM6772600.1 lytic polysaccharide monooxygenase [Nocardia pulmonis]MCM6784742.1 lytic polysaccharide monooxygenase [Nocardia sp. CDC159]
MKLEATPVVVFLKGIMRFSRLPFVSHSRPLPRFEEVDPNKIRIWKKLALAAAAATALCAALPYSVASAHGYVESRESRAVQCAKGLLPCGSIKYEPQSVEGPKGLKNCHANIPQFADLSDDSKPWKVHKVGQMVNFTWKYTARHRTQNWQYFIGDTKVGEFDGWNQMPDEKTTHHLHLSGFQGKQKMLAVWNIGDTANAFYQCIDLDIDRSHPDDPMNPNDPKPSDPKPTQKPDTPRPDNPKPSANPQPSNPKPDTPSASPTAWKVGASYKVGDVVTHEGKRWKCLQAHTAWASNWTPPATPALWQRA